MQADNDVIIVDDEMGSLSPEEQALAEQMADERARAVDGRLNGTKYLALAELEEMRRRREEDKVQPDTVVDESTAVTAKNIARTQP